MYWINDLDRFLELADISETPLKFYEVEGDTVKMLLLTKRNIGHKCPVTGTTLAKIKDKGFVEVSIEQHGSRWDW